MNTLSKHFQISRKVETFEGHPSKELRCRLRSFFLHLGAQKPLWWWHHNRSLFITNLQAGSWSPSKSPACEYVLQVPAIRSPNRHRRVSTKAEPPPSLARHATTFARFHEPSTAIGGGEWGLAESRCLDSNIYFLLQPLVGTNIFGKLTRFANYLPTWLRIFHTYQGFWGWSI